MAIFNSYVKLPEGNMQEQHGIFFSEKNVAPVGLWTNCFIVRFELQHQYPQWREPIEYEDNKNPGVYIQSLLVEQSLL